MPKSNVAGFPYPVQPKIVNYPHEQTSVQAQSYTPYGTNLASSNIYYGSNDNDQIYIGHSVNNSTQPSTLNQIGPNQIVVDLHSGHHHHHHLHHNHHHHMTYHNSECSGNISQLVYKSQQQSTPSTQKAYGQAVNKQHINQSQLQSHSQYGYKSKSQRFADITPACQSDHHQPFFGSIKENKLDPNEYLWTSTGQNKPSGSPYMTNTVQSGVQGPSQTTSTEPSNYMHSHLISHPLQHQYLYSNVSKGSSSSPTTTGSYQSNRPQKTPTQLSSSSSSQSSTNTHVREKINEK